jgi:3',5'-cyclic AMP phosphodiesterase CpdA
VRLQSGRKAPLCHVSNGQDIVATGKRGDYRLRIVPGLHRFLFVIPPDGYRAAGRFWWPCDAATGLPEGTDFTLRSEPAFRGRKLTALHVTDLHLPPTSSPDQDTRNAGILSRDLRQLLRQVPEAALVIATGDLTDDGRPAGLEIVARTLGRLPIPTYCIFGGHDGNTERFANGLRQFNMDLWTRIVGPPWYAFHAGGRHFLAGLSENDKYLDSDSEKLYHDFVAADLRLFGNRMPVTLCSHKNPYPWNSSIFRRYRVDSALYGHFHSLKTSHDRKILTFGTGALTMGSMDLTSAHARRLDFRGGRQPTAQTVFVSLRQRADGPDDWWRRSRRIAWRSPAKNLYSAAQPCLAGSRIYVGVADETSARNGGVVALDSRNGRRIWQTDLGPSVTSPVTLHDDVILANTIDGKVACIDAATGRLRWHRQLPNAYDRWINGRPIVADGRVYVGTSSYLACLDLQKGSRLWDFRAPEQTSDAMGRLQDPCYHAGRVFITGVNTPAYLLNGRTGKVVHREEGPAKLRLSGRLTVWQGKMLASDIHGNMHCFDLSSGRHEWFKAVSDVRMTSAAVDFHGSFLLGTAGGLGRYSYHKARRLAFFRPGNDLAPVVPYGRHATSCMGVPAVCGSDIWVGASDGYLYHLRGKSLQLVDRVNFRRPLTGHLVHDQKESLYVVGFDGRLYCVLARQQT